MHDLCLPPLVYLVFFVASVLCGIVLGWTINDWHRNAE